MQIKILKYSDHPVCLDAHTSWSKYAHTVSTTHVTSLDFLGQFFIIMNDAFP